MSASNQHSRDFEIVQAYIAYRGGLPEEAGAALRRIEEQLEAERRDWQLKDRALTDYFADASRRADDLQEQLEALQDEKAKAQQFGGDKDDRIAALENALCFIYWSSTNGDERVEQRIADVLSPERRVAWAKEHRPDSSPASEPETS